MKSSFALNKFSSTGIILTISVFAGKIAKGKEFNLADKYRTGLHETRDARLYHMNSMTRLDHIKGLNSRPPINHLTKGPLLNKGSNTELGSFTSRLRNDHGNFKRLSFNGSHLKSRLPEVKDFKYMSRAEVKQISRARYKDRLDTLEDFCSKWYRATRYKRQRNHWRYLEHYNVLACFHHKAGSTAMTSYMSQANARVHRGMGHKPMLKCKSLQTAKAKKDNDTFIFTIVRHPLDHLVSAYHQFRTMKHGPYFFNHFKDFSTDHPWSPSELVDKLVENRIFMEHKVHFNPYFQNCDLCSKDFKLDAILKMETWSQDLRFMSKALQIQEFQQHATRLNSHMVNENYDPVRDFYSRINLTQFQRIVEFYRPDFDMFGYDPLPFYKYLK